MAKRLKKPKEDRDLTRAREAVFGSPPRRANTAQLTMTYEEWKAQRLEGSGGVVVSAHQDFVAVQLRQDLRCFFHAAEETVAYPKHGVVDGDVPIVFSNQHRFHGFDVRKRAIAKANDIRVSVVCVGSEVGDVHGKSFRSPQTGQCVSRFAHRLSAAKRCCNCHCGHSFMLDHDTRGQSTIALVQLVRSNSDFELQLDHGFDSSPTSTWISRRNVDQKVPMASSEYIGSRGAQLGG